MIRATDSAEREAEFAEAVAKAAGTALGQPLRINRSRTVQGDGGARRQVLEAEDGRRVFLKSVAEEDQERLLCERDGLLALAEPAAFRTPAVLACSTAGGRGFLLLEFLQVQPLDEEGAARAGRALADLHADTEGRFGWHRDNFIGRGRQPNGQGDDWADFWCEQRLQHQVSALHDAGAARPLLALLERLPATIEQRLSAHRPLPSLLHGDLWAGNLGQDERGRPVFYDPAVYRGDRECDLAMTTLFGGVPAALSRSYQAAWPLSEGHAWRRELYNLYHLLNHALLFGGGYHEMAARSSRRLLQAPG